MSSIQRRLSKIEKLLDIDRKKPIVNVTLRLSHKAGFAPEIPEPLEDWITYKQAVKEAQETGQGLLFVADPFREYEVRNDLPEGMISMDKRKGEIPFSELLEVAKKDYQKNPKIRKYRFAITH